VIEQNLTSLTEGVSRDIQRVTTQLQQEFENTISESNDVLAKQITELDQSMQDQLRRSIELMGGHLAALSNKFVEDYGPLTDRLRQVVTIAERL
jgi:methyl-accepting chemotaxis protein